MLYRKKERGKEENIGESLEIIIGEQHRKGTQEKAQEENIGKQHRKTHKKNHKKKQKTQGLLFLNLSKRSPVSFKTGLLFKGRQRPTLPDITLVPSAQLGLTSLFEMGRGGHQCYSHHKTLVH